MRNILPAKIAQPTVHVITLYYCPEKEQTLVQKKYLIYESLDGLVLSIYP